MPRDHTQILKSTDISVAVGDATVVVCKYDFLLHGQKKQLLGLHVLKTDKQLTAKQYRCEKLNLKNWAALNFPHSAYHGKQKRVTYESVQRKPCFDIMQSCLTG